ncbi:sialidase family protein [Prosthecobacter sp. SYSU 5D2]|uniref:sialidase family protein n=1 Tax=Prosthecobacter sp. SYSU 5D2 TaxID=3134134 RepID=UPI0031FE740A
MKSTTLILGSLLALSSTLFAAEDVKVLETKTISFQPDYYLGWPTLLRQKDNRLIIVFSGGRQAHVCPFGRLEFITSQDDGQTWSFPRTILDTDIDDRDAGILETSKGTLLATTFTSTAYETYLNLAKEGKPAPYAKPETLPLWEAAHSRLTHEQRQSLRGEWLVRSTDNGLTWSAPIRTLVDSPHGPAELADGRLLYVGRELVSKPPRIGVSESNDDGLTWRWLSEIPVRAGDKAGLDYHELHAVQANDGRIIAQIRHHGETNHYETLQTESEDGGKTWSEPRSIGVWGYPSHLLKLRDGTLLMTYGHRRAPFGNQARISRDHGRTWSSPLMISEDGQGQDLGYPSSAELADGTLLTVWYERLKGDKKTVLRQAHWKLNQ